MKSYLQFSVLVVCAACLLCCTRTPNGKQIETGNKYARGFSLTEKQCYTEAVIYNPWRDSCVMQRFFLVRDTAVSTPSDGIRLQVPLHSVATTSCTQIGFLAALNRLSIVKGIASPELIYTPLPHSDWVNIGDAMQPQLERIMLAKPEVIFLTAYQDQDKLQSVFSDHNIIPVYINEWTEQHPLARAEWIRFFGVLFGEKPVADSLFCAVEQQYLHLTDSVKKYLSKGSTLLTGSDFRGTWYMPTGNTYMGMLFSDAGADYYYQNRTENKSLPLSEEEVLLHFKDAQVWVGCNARSLDELAQIDSKHTLFQAYQTGQVFNFSKRSTPTGGNDFWETGVIHPELILSDLIHICHSDTSCIPANKLYFSEQLR